MDEDEFILRPIEDGDSFTSFRTGDADFAPLKMFAKTKAKPYEKANLARTYVVCDQTNNRVAAYITLVCSEVRSAETLADIDGHLFPYEQYPAVKIARLMVDERYRGNGLAVSKKLGSVLIDFALGIAKNEIAEWVGCRFIIVDAKAKSVAFYEKVGFTLLDTPDNKARAEKVMFVDLSKL
ncbi:GNAT family N-acetyltransferase [Asticcacaulis taihuensis]|uniref:GNAT family N-acetyltransferase n=1 Tax=Asticcacaulis taihuensis TaxID=260084 RepID=UPI0026EE47FC|nr:GNAT family N-acetyltransferase [Asticcacaulis taihuensis]